MSLPIKIKGMNVEELAKRLYQKWAQDGRMPLDLFTLALQDILIHDPEGMVDEKLSVEINAEAVNAKFERDFNEQPLAEKYWEKRECAGCGRHVNACVCPAEQPHFIIPQGKSESDDPEHCKCGIDFHLDCDCEDICSDCNLPLSDSQKQNKKDYNS